MGLTILLILKVNSCVLHHFCTEREAFFKRVGSMRRIFCAFILLFMASIFLRCANFLSFFFKFLFSLFCCVLFERIVFFCKSKMCKSFSEEVRIGLVVDAFGAFSS